MTWVPSGGPPQLLNDRYLVLGSFGESTMCSVLLARDIAAGGRVVIKHFRRAVGVPQVERERRERRIAREATILKGINHPGIPAYRATFEEKESGQNFLVMEYVEGTTLGDFLEQNGPVVPSVAAAIAVQLCRILAELHGRSTKEWPIVHRDIKPPNVMISVDGVVKLLDFGIAGIADPSGERITEDGYPAASHDYASIEQMENQTPAPEDDLFGLGCVVYELVTGEQAFYGDGSDEWLRREYPPVQGVVPHLPDGFAELVNWLLAPRRADRPSDVAEIGDRFERFVLKEVDPQAPSPDPTRWFRANSSGPVIRPRRRRCWLSRNEIVQAVSTTASLVETEADTAVAEVEKYLYRAMDQLGVRDRDVLALRTQYVKALHAAGDGTAALAQCEALLADLELRHGADQPETKDGRELLESLRPS